jgi:iron complex outermembrane receptor protein
VKMDGLFGGSMRAGLMAGAAIVCVATASPTYAQTRNFNVPEQDAATGVAQFARQADVQLLISARDARGHRTNEVHGSMDVRAGLGRLLNGTGLRAESTGPSTFSVVSVPGEDQAGSVAADSEGAQGTILVTGTRIAGAGQIANPSTTITREDIERSGITSTEELVRRIPQNFAAVAPNTSRGPNAQASVTALNTDRASGIDLRGLGVESTLTLVNGQRRAGDNFGRTVDVSTLPLDLIDRVEVVTGGSSAIYGSDAVAGVTNFILRRRYNGLDARLAESVGEHGYSRTQLTATAGRDFGRGGFVLSVNRSIENPLNIVQSDLFSNPTGSGDFFYLPEGQDTRRTSVYLSGEFNVTSSLRLYGDASFAREARRAFSRYRFTPTSSDSIQDAQGHADDYGGLFGADLRLGTDWTMTGVVSRSVHRGRNRDANDADFDGFLFVSDDVNETHSATTSYSLNVNGELPIGSNFRPKITLGAEYLTQSLLIVAVSQDGALLNRRDVDNDRSIKSVFGEVLLPLIEAGNGFVRHIAITGAGRYDDYRTFGTTFNPQIGAIIGLKNGISFRGSYSTAYRVPSLYDTNVSQGTPFAFLQLLADPRSPTGTSPVVYHSGLPLDIGPERSRNFTASVDYQPVFAPWLTATLSYYDIRYRDRIASPIDPFNDALRNEQYYPGLIIRNPSQADVAAVVAGIASNRYSNRTGTPFNPATQNLLSVFPNLVVINKDKRNIAIETTNGLDFQARARGTLGDWTLLGGINLTYSLNHRRFLTPTSPGQLFQNRVGLPAQFRFHANAGFERGPLGIYIDAYHVGGYPNQLSTARPTVGSWTTIDLTVRFDTSRLVSSGALRGWLLSATVSNLFDQRPPYVDDPSAVTRTGYFYDPANTSGLGRVMTFRIAKSF